MGSIKISTSLQSFLLKSSSLFFFSPAPSKLDSLSNYFPLSKLFSFRQRHCSTAQKYTQLQVTLAARQPILAHRVFSHFLALLFRFSPLHIFPSRS